MGFAMKAAICFALALAAVSAQHAEDIVVPEATQEVEPMELVDTSAVEAINAAAHQEATAYLQKAGSDACKALADSAEKAVKDNVKAEQAILDKIDKGAKCPEEGQDAVSAMNSKLSGAKDAQKKADKAYSDARDADVDFGKRKYSGLTKGNCNTFFNSQAFLDAERKVNDTKKKKDAAKGKVDQAKKDLDAAIAAAKVAVIKCQCKTHQAHVKALAAANAQVKSANSKSWTKAAHLKCVLAGTPYNKCTVPAIPLVKKTSVAKGVTAGKCSLWDGHAQCNRMPVGASGNPNDYTIKAMYRDSSSGWNAGCFMKAQISDPADGPWRLEADYNPTGARGGHGSKNAIWGLSNNPDGAKHRYTNIDFAFYCHNENQWAQIYECPFGGKCKWHSNGNGMNSNHCKCSSQHQWTSTRIIVGKDGRVDYQMKSNHHGWNTCRLSAVGAAKGPYMFDSSIEGNRVYMTNIKLLQEVNGKWVGAK